MNLLQLICKYRISQSSYFTLRQCSSVVNKDKNTQSTIDKSEVDFMGSLSKEWWDENGPVKALHALNEIRVQFIRSGLINSGRLKEKEILHNPVYLQNINIADIGCGGGILSLNLARLGSNVLGLEPSKDLVNVAKQAVEKYKPIGKIEILAASVEEYVQDNPNTFDAVVCSEVIEHVTKKGEFVEACVKLVKPGGSIFFTTPNRTPPGRLFSIFAAEYVLRLLPVGTHQYDKFITPEELKQILDKNSCDTQMVNGFIYSPLNNTYYWVPSPAIQYALHAVKIK